MSASIRKILAGIVLCLELVGCAGPLTQFNFQADELQRVPDFTGQNLKTQKFAIVASTHDDNFKRVLADSFSKALKQTRPDISQIPPQEVLSILNRGGLADEYTGMLRDYGTSSILRKTGLNPIGKALGVSYLIHLSLLQYSQDTSSRINFMGLRLIQTRSSTLRVYAEIWDTATGEIVWGGSSTVTLAEDRVRDKPIPVEEVAARAWTELIKQLPAVDPHKP